MPTTLNDIQEFIEKSIARFNRRVPAVQKQMYEQMLEEVARLELNGSKIKTTVKNLRIINSIKGKLLRIILTDDYKKDVRQFAEAFREVTRMQNEYWVTQESTFKPRPLLREIRKQAIGDTVKNLGASGIGETISEHITDILRTNITSGGTIAALQRQLRGSILTTSTDGLLEKYSKQITTDAINQYSAQYTQTVSTDLGYEWFAYQGSDIKTTRPFCDAMTDIRYFHISQVPNLLKGKDADGTPLHYEKKGKTLTVGLYDKTKLPNGMIPGTNPANFFVNRGGYNCGHQIRPVSALRVPEDIQTKVFATNQYKNWKAANG